MDIAAKKKKEEFKGPPQKWTYRVTTRPQTPEEERRLVSAINLFLTEWVRQRMGQEKENDL